MLGLRTAVCYALSKRLLRPPAERASEGEQYMAWRDESLREQWSFFEHHDLAGKRVLDFGCGAGGLTLYLARFGPEQIVGVELARELIDKAESRRQEPGVPYADRIRFIEGKRTGIPVEDASFDFILGFDMLEHVMAPLDILSDWHRVLRPGGRVLIWWSPFRGPWGPHMESLVPIPWAHVVFGERAMFETAAKIYDDERYVPRAWDLDEEGRRLPNKWKAWKSFSEQAYVNELSLSEFRDLVGRAGLRIARYEPHGFGGSKLRRTVASALMQAPLFGEYMTSFVIIELERPA